MHDCSLLLMRAPWMTLFCWYQRQLWHTNFTSYFSVNYRIFSRAL